MPIFTEATGIAKTAKTGVKGTQRKIIILHLFLLTFLAERGFLIQKRRTTDCGSPLLYYINSDDIAGLSVGKMQRLYKIFRTYGNFMEKV